MTNRDHSSQLKVVLLVLIFIRELGQTYRALTFPFFQMIFCGITDVFLGQSRLAWELSRHSYDILATDHTAPRKRYSRLQTTSVAIGENQESNES